MSDDFNLIKFTSSISVLHSAQVTAFENSVKNGGDILRVKYYEKLNENRSKPPEVTAVPAIRKKDLREKKVYDSRGKIIHINF